MLEEQQALLAKEREQEAYGEWQAREEAFHHEIAMQRTNIRIKQGMLCWLCERKSACLKVGSVRVIF